MTTEFIKKFEQCLIEKDSILCVGLDPALPAQREKNTIPLKYLEKTEESQARLDFCLDIIDKTSDFCIAAKPNEQYVRGFNSQQHKKLTNALHKRGLLSIYDCKLGDIRSTAESAIYHFRKWGYDAITFNPFPGNMEEVVRISHKSEHNIGIIVLTLMSNPEAEKLMRYASVKSKPVYLALSEDVKKYNADGCVVGATGHVTQNDIRLIRNTIGNEKVILIPGIGTQKGDPKKVIQAGGRNIMINVGRDIIFSNDVKTKAQEYSKIFNKLRKANAFNNLN